MLKHVKPYFLQSRTSVHAGSGSDLGVIDLPIQREKHTGFPKIESSSLKGALRETLESKDEQEKAKLLDALITGGSQTLNLDSFGAAIDATKKAILHYDHTIHLLFGYDGDTPGYSEKIFGKNTEFAGALAFTDVRLLLFPVKTMRGVFCWITCPYVLKRLEEDLSLAGVTATFGNISVDQGKCLVADQSHHVVNNFAILEEYAFSVGGPASQIADILIPLGLPDDLKKRLIVLNDDDYKDFVIYSTEVITRIKINNETGAVETRALFNEEYLPSESILYFLTTGFPAFGLDDVKGIFKNTSKAGADELRFFDQALPGYFQIGGNATIGKGIVKVIRTENKQGGNNA